MKVLIACEESQRVCRAFRMKGHEAYSCDIQECSGYLPQYHIHANCLPLLNGDFYFTTQDGKLHTIDGEWDLIIAHPPCTYLATSGSQWFNIDKYGDKAIERQKKREEAIKFFMCFVNAKCKRIAIENPVGIMSTIYRKPDQIINPYQFGHPETKRTCLWLKGLPPLKETNNVYEYMMTLPEKQRHRILWLGSNHSKERSKTYWGIAQAMTQWGE